MCCFYLCNLLKCCCCLKESFLFRYICKCRIHILRLFLLIMFCRTQQLNQRLRQTVFPDDSKSADNSA